MADAGSVANGGPVGIQEKMNYENAVTQVVGQDANNIELGV